mmetsp:Transcript_12511/g.15528  ORF Transcript_12511/g.15528 Transcript_12511/m.15528 type:complete len:256 (-) Transcript_12511:221-988(-)
MTGSCNNIMRKNTLFRKSRKRTSRSSTKVVTGKISPKHGLKKLAELLSHWQSPFKFIPHEDHSTEEDEQNGELTTCISNPNFVPAMAKVDEEAKARGKEECRLIIDSVTDSIMQKIVETKNPEDAFDYDKVPVVSLNEYLYRCIKYMNHWYKDEPNVKSTGMRSLFLSLVYIQHLQKVLPGFQLNEFNIHRLFLITMLIGAKFTEDKPISNKYWAKVGGICVDQLNQLESAFCSISEFKLYVGDDELDRVYDEYH